MTPRIAGLGADITTLLRSAGHLVAADDLGCLLEQLDSADGAKRIAAAQEIQKRCHVRWLGDLAVDIETLGAWWGKLESLADAVEEVKRLGDAKPREVPISTSHHRV